MPWKVLDLAGKIQHVAVGMFPVEALRGQRRPTVELLGIGVLLAG